MMLVSKVLLRSWPYYFSPLVDVLELVNSSLTEVAVVEGDTLELVCTFFGRPRPMVEWSGPQDILPPAIEDSVSVSGGYQVTSTLKVLNASQSDEGEYSCEGEVPDYPAPSKTQYFLVGFQSEFPVGRHCTSMVTEIP